MKAIVCEKYGSAESLVVRELAIPEPADKEVQIKVRATTVTAADSMMRRGEPGYARLFLGFSKPKKPIPGTGFSGEVSAIGPGVTRFKVGDIVFGESGINFGANAEYLCVSEEGVLLHKPDCLNFEEAASVCDGPVTALNFIRDKGEVKAGDKVLVNGASGSVGMAAVQIAKALGADVTGVCSSANAELVYQLGADRVIDYNKEDFTLGSQRFDVIFDAVGKSSFSASKSVLKENGRYLSAVLSLPLLAQMLWTAKFCQQKAIFSATGLKPASEVRDMVNDVVKRFQSGELKTIVDRRYPLEQVAEAHRYVDTGRKKGNVVVTLNHLV